MQSKPKLSVITDFLRDEPNGLEPHPMNRRWLAAVLKPLAGNEYDIVEHGFDCNGGANLSVVDFMRSLSVPLGINGWATAWDQMPSDAFIQKIKEHFADSSIVIGWGLPNVVAKALSASNISFIDFEVSPIRFFEELQLEARTNILPLVETQLWSCPQEIQPQIASFCGWAARHSPETIPIGGARVGVVFGQSEIDAALIHEGRLASFSDFADELFDWTRDLDWVLFRPHPYASSHQAFEEIYRIVPTVRPTLMNSYQLLSSQRLTKVIALSSGIIDEALHFQVDSTRLFVPRRRCTELARSQSVNLNVLRADVLSAILNGQSPRDVTSTAYNLRNQFRVNWAFPPEAVSPDFYSPPQLIQPELPAPTTPELEETTSLEANSRADRLYKKVIRETNRIANQVRDVASSLRGQVHTDTGSQKDSDADKDYGYNSGERQIACYYYQIRRDHQARYELADRIIPEGVDVLDAFCGNGYGSFLLSRSRDVLGIDGSDDAISVAKQHFSHNGARFEARRFPFELSTQFDAVVSFESIEHIDDELGFFNSLCNLVKPGGLLVFSTPNQDLLPFDPEIQIHHCRHYTLQETLHFAHENDLAVSSWYGQQVYKLNLDASPEMLCQSRMELVEKTPGQFTVVVARKAP